ncbi:MAG: hypothetical protein DI551_00800 [Micavibrio aeruginosavorus]|uniref:Uncharacterized protein n=1 Tax=Micavibrio aeruginosavorus TaxID=349221 RepID=A0A2W5N5Z9_9BACT|nr:MAG: hypothetical protein DI551_00800 [Micavibrio aeruginosavorus]
MLALKLKLGVSRPALSPEVELFVASTNSNLPYGRYATSSGRRAFVQRTNHKLGFRAPYIQLCVPGAWFFNSSGGDSSLGNNINWDKLSVEVGGAYATAKFNGGRAFAAADDDWYYSQPIYYSELGGSGDFLRNTTIQIRGQGNVSQVGHYLTEGSAAYTGADAASNAARCWLYDPDTVSVDPVDGTGPIANPSGGSQKFFAVPAFIVAPNPDGTLVLAGIGDSIPYGINDNTFGGQSEFGGYGWARAAVGTGNPYAYLSMACPSELALQFLTGSLSARRQKFLKMCNGAVINYGTNDYGFTGTGLVAAVQAAVMGVVDLVADKLSGASKIILCPLLCSTSSTSGNYTSKADQTVKSGWNAGENRDVINSYFASQVGTKVFALADTLTQVSDPTDNHYWLTNGTNAYGTGDGGHPRQATYTLAAANAIRPAIQAMEAAHYS